VLIGRWPAMKDIKQMPCQLRVAEKWPQLEGPSTGVDGKPYIGIEKLLMPAGVTGGRGQSKRTCRRESSSVKINPMPGFARYSRKV
jgi:hypothetical protein